MILHTRTSAKETNGRILEANLSWSRTWAKLCQQVYLWFYLSSNLFSKHTHTKVSK